MKLSNFVTEYLEMALWSSYDNSNDQGGDPLDKNYSIDDIAPEAIEKAIVDCNAFQNKAKELLYGISDSIAAHDFWLTRNRHGAGF